MSHFTAPRQTKRSLTGAKPSGGQAVVLLLVWLISGGCTGSEPATRHSSLLDRLRPKPITPGPNDVVLDLVYLEREFGDEMLNQDIWASADEQQFDLSVRRALEARGFRIAVLGGQLPDALKELLQEEGGRQYNGEHLQLRQGTTTQVHTSGRYPAWPGAIAKEPGDRPGPYTNAVGSLRVIPKITREGYVDLSLRPEIRYGEPVRQFVPSDDQNGPLNWTVRISQPVHSFEELTFSLQLQPDQVALFSCTDPPDSLGAHFFARTDNGQRLQRVVLIRAGAPGHNLDHGFQVPDFRSR